MLNGSRLKGVILPLSRPSDEAVGSAERYINRVSVDSFLPLRLIDHTRLFYSNSLLWLQTEIYDAVERIQVEDGWVSMRLREDKGSGAPLLMALN